MKGNSGRTFAQACRVVAVRYGSPALLLGAVCGVVCGCASRHPSAIDAAGLESDTSNGETTEVAATTASSIAPLIENRRSLLEPAAGHVGLAFVDGTGYEAVIVEGADATTGYKVTELSEPARVVLDLSGATLPGGKVYDLPESSVISRLRTGTHPDKTRIVFDVKGSLSGSPVAEWSNGALELRFPTQPTMTSLEAESSPSADMASASVPDTSSASTETLADEEMAGAITPAESISTASTTLLGFSIEPIDGSQNMLIAETSTPSEFSLKRTAPSEYVLTLQGVSLGELPSETLVAPPSAGAIRSVRPVTQGGSTTLRIFTAPTVSLSAESSGRKIVVAKAEGAYADMRAQAPTNGEAAKEGAAAATDSAAEETATAASNPASTDEFAALLDETPRYTGRLISLDLQDTDIDNALRIIAEVSNLNIIASDDVAGKVTLRLIDVPWDQALDVILKTNGLDKVQEGNVVRIAPVEKLRAEREALKQAQQAEEELEPLGVKYVRVSYARAAELKPLVETVLSERGSVTYDDRTNQLIVKDIRKGIRNVAELVTKIDLRTPQVLLETQIVEASRSLLRDLGSEIGFSSIQSPATGNATGHNFPNSVVVGGSLAPGGVGSGFPAAVSASEGSAVSLLLGSADGTLSLSARLTALEQEGRVRIISRPAVATTNNKQAVIKSVEKIRVKTPDGGLSVATGQGATAAGNSTTATEAIEIGIELEVTPQASPDYYVLLDVRAKSSTFGDREVDGIPSEVERSANSTVLVSSGQTFAMGGIYKITDRDSVSGVPFIKDVPVLGTFFRRQSVDNSDEELLFFITPRIIEGSFDDAAMKMAS
ncbi:MAG: type IV pilus secretin PilQ [Bdellovibrionota bacterium]|nr:MAG: type IV pilus secretin PilQ [Bdellovibrionota bacterium]